MTPLEQTFWCERFQYYFHRQEPDGNTVPDIRHFALHNADLDLEEFRKRFGGDEVKPDKLETALDIMDRNNQTPKTTLYPWELLPEDVTHCATDADGTSLAYFEEPDFLFTQWSPRYRADRTKPAYLFFRNLGILDVPVPDWRMSLEARPLGGKK